MVKTQQPNSTSHRLFWGAISGSLLRGRLSDVVNLLSNADFQHAITSDDDGSDKLGYRGMQLQNVQRMVNKTRHILEACPGYRGNWQTNDSDWRLYRRKVKSALDSLVDFQEQVGSHETGRFGFRARCNLPSTVYTNLRIIYGILLGNTSEIRSSSQDWVEAAIAMTVWWDGTNDEGSSAWSSSAFAASRYVGRSQQEQSPYDYVRAAYLRRLADAYLEVTDPEDPQSMLLSNINDVEIGLGALLEGDVEAVLLYIRSWSLVVAAAAVEVASMGKWLRLADPSAPAEFDQSDLMVMSYRQGLRQIHKDDMISEYANELFAREQLVTEQGEIREAWELAIEVASRLGDDEWRHNTINEMLRQLPLDSQDQMDTVVRLCVDLGLEEKAHEVAEVGKTFPQMCPLANLRQQYADLVVGKSDSFGAALMCYARARAAKKIRSVVDLLISYSILQSSAYPPTDEMDDALAGFVNDRRGAIASIAEVDPDGAELLQRYFSGYATLRKFYAVRDEETTSQKSDRPSSKPLTRKRAAAQALVALISSAADSIYGGLYDETRDSVVQVDGLLALLGEALPFVNRE